jgi:hypothetical protein
MRKMVDDAYYTYTNGIMSNFAREPAFTAQKKAGWIILWVNKWAVSGEEKSNK